jgi:quercetin dioxygenase-like cupin family protein
VEFDSLVFVFLITYNHIHRYSALIKEMDMKVFKMAQINKEPQVSPIFTGPVTMQTIIGADLSKRFLIRNVNFGRGIRNKFHSHNIEQVLIVTEGKGIVATDKEEISVVPGDIIFVPAGEKHWHGAANGSTFSHLYVMSPESKTIQLED